MKKEEISLTTEREHARDFAVLTFTADQAAQAGFSQALLLRMSEGADILFTQKKAEKAAVGLAYRGQKGIWQVRLRGMRNSGRPSNRHGEYSWIYCWPDKRPTYERWCVLAGRIRDVVRKAAMSKLVKNTYIGKT